MTKAAVAVALSAGALTAVGVTSAQAAGTAEGCPSGAVCIYPQDAGWNGGHPSLFFYSYGAHNLSNQYGHHYVFNNQTGGAKMRSCTGYNGTGCGSGYLPAGTYDNPDLTPINSITLEP